jgi:outer membrane protein OmpA-like peptidoglycan-associated protein
MPSMKRVSCRAVLTLLLSCATAASAQSDALPPGAKGRVLDLVFRVENLGGKVQDLRARETDTEIRIELAADVLFDFDKAELLPKSREALHQAAEFVREKAKAKSTVRIAGHTDAKGDANYNQNLSERRANAVKNWFVAKEGLQNVNFVTAGFGKQQPVAPNTKQDGSDDPEGRQKNRRVEITIKK